VVLVQLVAEGLEDGLKDGRFRGSHIGIGLGMQTQRLAFPGSFGAHRGVWRWKRVCTDKITIWWI
jgi:hypothetical protein